MINTWELWVQNWDNAYRFFKSTGNVKTKSVLKNKWHKDFMQMFKTMEENKKPIDYHTLEEDLISCFKKRNIDVSDIAVAKGATLYIIKVKRK